MTQDQLSALWAKIDNVKQAGLYLSAVECYNVGDGNWTVYLGANGSPTQNVPAPAFWFMITAEANIRSLT